MIATDFKDKLMSALQDSVGHLNSGMTPNESVAKAASDADFNTEQTRRLCETFNTARTIYHFQSKPDAKEASFPLADQDEVLGIIFSAPIKSAVVDDIFHDYSEYEVKEVMAKAAQEDTPLFPSPLENSLPVMNDTTRQAMINENARRTNRIVDTQNRLADGADSEADQSDILADTKIAKLAAEISAHCELHGTDKYARFLGVQANMVNTHAPFMAMLAQHIQHKVAASSAKVIDDRDLASWNKVAHEITDMKQAAANLRAVSQEVRKEAAAYRQEFDNLFKPESELKEGVFDDILRGDIKAAGKSKPNSFFSLSSLGFGGAEEPKSKPTSNVESQINAVNDIAASAAKHPADMAMSTISSALTPKNNTGKMMERLKNQQREVLMQDLITNDPYISEADPQMVANIYQQLAQLSPEVSTNKEVVRAILRQGIHSAAISPYDASAMVDLEKTIREVNGTLPLRKKE